MLPFANQLDVKRDTAEIFSLDTFHTMKNGKPLFFAAAQIKKNYVSFYLMPIYVTPGLLKGVSSALRKRMQGKSCFNFKSVDSTLFVELEILIQAGFVSYQEQGYVPLRTPSSKE